MDFHHDITEKTKRGYEQRVTRLEKDGYKFNESITETAQFLSQYPVQTQLDLLNVILVIQREKKQDIKLLQLLRDKLTKKSKIITKKRLENKTLMSETQFLRKLNELFDTQQWLKYILNYLCFTFGTRNEDLNISFTPTDGNYLIYENGYCVYVRNIYKTVRTYGSKRHIIQDPKFIHAYSLCNPFSTTDIGSFLKLKLIMKESDIFKMRIKELEDNEDSEGIQILGESRGTNISTILSHYNLNTKKYIIS
jgi:hypothetical protein